MPELWSEMLDKRIDTVRGGVPGSEGVVYVLRTARGGSFEMTFREWRIRRKTMRNLKETMHRMTLNAIGPIYGCCLKEGESNRHFEKRILKAHMTSEKLWILKDPKINVEVTTDEQSNIDGPSDKRS